MAIRVAQERGAAAVKFSHGDAELKRNWNWPIWVGFAVALAATFSFTPFFSRFAATRDFPWANLVLFAIAEGLLGLGLYRAFAKSRQYRGKVSGTVFGALTLLLCTLFCYGSFVAVRDLPSPSAALRVGQQAPDFRLTRSDGTAVTLSSLRQTNRTVLLIFYRGYW
jgi:hypothetical protein